MTYAPAVEVSKATQADLADVLALVRDCELLETGVAEAIENFVVARTAGSLTGCAGLEVYGALVLRRSVAVRGSTRRAGLGSELVARVTAAARALELRELFLLTTTASLSERTRTQDRVSSDEALISWCGTKGGT